MHTAVIEACPGEDLAKSIGLSLEAEARQPAAPAKGRVEISVRGPCVVIRVYSEEISGLRAILNSYLYLLHAAWQALEAVRQQ